MILTAITIWLISWFITEFLLIQNFIMNLAIKYPNKYLLHETLSIFQCWKCLTFWIFTIYSLVTFSPIFFTFGLICSFLTIPIKKYIL